MTSLVIVSGVNVALSQNQSMLQYRLQIKTLLLKIIRLFRYTVVSKLHAIFLVKVVSSASVSLQTMDLC